MRTVKGGGADRSRETAVFDIGVCFWNNNCCDCASLSSARWIYGETETGNWHLAYDMLIRLHLCFGYLVCPLSSLDTPIQSSRRESPAMNKRNLVFDGVLDNLMYWKTGFISR